MMPKVSIVVVNWNAGDQLVAMADSIALHHSGLVDSLIIVDNASSDNSTALVEARAATLPFPLHVIRNDVNRGFGAACNQGGSIATGDYVLFLNPDTALFENSLSTPISYMSRTEAADIGIVGIQLLDENGEVARSCSRFPSLRQFFAQALGINRLRPFRLWTQPMIEWAHDADREVDQVIGAFFLMRRSLFDRLHGFDERFFVYFEEVDFSFRAKQAGFRSVYLAGAQAFHAGGGTSRQVKAHRLFYALRSRMLYGFKHFSTVRAWALVFVTLCIEPVSRSVFSLREGWSGVRNTLAAYGMLYGDLGNILQRRRFS